MQGDHLHREIYLYLRSAFAVLRIITDAGLIVFSVFWSAFGGWKDPWTQTSDLMWRQSHMALIVFEIGIHPINSEFVHTITLERLHLFLYRTLSLWALAADAGVIVKASQRVYETDGESQYVERLAIACTVAAMNVWRIGEVFLSEMKHRKEAVQLHPEYALQTPAPKPEFYF